MDISLYEFVSGCIPFYCNGLFYPGRSDIICIRRMTLDALRRIEIGENNWKEMNLLDLQFVVDSNV